MRVRAPSVEPVVLKGRRIVLRTLRDNDFEALKKALTSIMRRLAPIGLATTILMTGNHRVWRHLISMRTSRHAEEEIRMVFNKVYEQQLACYPNIYQDAKTEMVDGLLEVTFRNEKV